MIDDRMIADRFRAWLEARPPLEAAPSVRDVVLDDSAINLPRSVPANAVIFAPEQLVNNDVPDVTATVVPYRGVLDVSGAEVEIGNDLVVQLEGYSTAEFLDVACPTCITIVDGSDRSLLRADSRRAYESGAFPDHLLDPLVTFAGIAAAVGWAPAETATAHRFWAGLSDELEGPDGQHIRRYLVALRAFQLAAGRVDTRSVRIVGFGDAGPLPEVDAPIVMHAANGAAYIADPRKNLFGAVRTSVADVVADTAVGRIPSRLALDDLGVGEWSSMAKAALFARLGLALPSPEEWSNDA